MTDLVRQLRQWLASDGDESHTDGDRPAVPVPPVAPPFDRTVSARRADDEPVAGPPQTGGGPAERLEVAQGQELLGPCRGCDGYWTREITRGQKPLTCPVCKRDGPPDG